MKLSHYVTARVAVVVLGLAACGSNNPRLAVSRSPNHVASSTSLAASGYPKQAADQALCSTYNSDIQSGDIEGIQAALTQAGGSVSPALVTAMTRVVNLDSSRS